MVPSSILLMYMVLTVLAAMIVLLHIEKTRPAPVTVVVNCGNGHVPQRRMQRREWLIRNGRVNGSGLLVRSSNGDMVNLGKKFPKGIRVEIWGVQGA